MATAFQVDAFQNIAYNLPLDGFQVDAEEYSIAWLRVRSAPQGVVLKSRGQDIQVGSSAQRIVVKSRPLYEDL